MLEAADRVMARVVSREVSEFYERAHAQAGVEIHCGAAVRELHGATRVESVEIADGRRFKCDAAIVGIGIVPNVELAQSAGLECANGISVDEHARTADENIVAAGDCTSHPHPLYARAIRLESVQNAIHQAKVAAGIAARDAEPVFGSAVVLVGSIRPEAADRGPLAGLRRSRRTWRSRDAELRGVLSRAWPVDRGRRSEQPARVPARQETRRGGLGNRRRHVARSAHGCAGARLKGSGPDQRARYSPAAICDAPRRKCSSPTAATLRLAGSRSVSR